MVFFELENGQTISLPTKPSDLTFGQWVDLKGHLIRYDEAVKDADNLMPEVHLIDALQIVLPGVDFSEIPVASNDPEDLSLHRLIGLASSCILMDEVEDLKGQELEFKGYRFDPARYAQFGPSVQTYIEVSELQRLMPNEPFTNSEATQKFYSLTLKQAAVVMRDKKLPLDFTERDAVLDADAEVLKDMPASYALAISHTLVNFLRACSEAQM